MPFAWPKPVWVYDYENDKLVREMSDFRSATQFVNRQEDEHVITFRKLKNPAKELEKAWCYSNHDDEEDKVSTTKAEQWFAEVMRSPKTVKELPPGVIEYFVVAAKQAYYNEANPIISDAQFDKIELMLKKLNPKSPALATGAPVQEEKGVGGKIELPFYLGSMNKIKDNVEDWKYAGPYTVTDKLDGYSLLYANVNGKDRLYTRGNGLIGQDVTHLIPFLKLPKLKPRQAVRGELLMSKSAFKKFATEFKNPRNMMAGLVNRKGDPHIAIGSATFVAFEQIFPRTTHYAQLESLGKQGFNTPYVKRVKQLSTPELLKMLLARKKTSQYEMDGLVITDDNPHTVNKSGNPSWAFSFKANLESDMIEAKVVDVVWEVTRYGRLMPVLIVGPM